jgi:hypothetical protein
VVGQKKIVKKEKERISKAKARCLLLGRIGLNRPISVASKRMFGMSVFSYGWVNQMPAQRVMDMCARDIMGRVAKKV